MSEGIKKALSLTQINEKSIFIHFDKISYKTNLN